MTMNEVTIVGLKQIAPLTLLAVLVGIGATIIAAVIYGIILIFFSRKHSDQNQERDKNK